MKEEHDTTQLWAQQEGEPLEWFRRFTVYRLMETKRSVAAVFHKENSKKLEKTRKNSEPDGTWYEKAKQWRWEERAKAWDMLQVAQEEKLIEQERAKVLRKRYALMHKRVQVLDRIAQKLISMTNEEDKVWVADVKSIGNGPLAERVDLVQFNDALFKEIREYLTDIADEMGERVKTTKQELTGKDGSAIVVETQWGTTKVQRGDEVDT